MSQVGIPLFYLQHLREMQFLLRDIFKGVTLEKMWRKYLGEISVIGKDIIVQNGKCEISIDNAINAKWDTANNEAPRIWIGKLESPVDVTVRLDEFTPLDKTQAGLFYAKRPGGFGALLHIDFVRRRDDLGGQNGIAVTMDSYNDLAYVAVTDLPIWLRIKIYSDSYMSGKFRFMYSTDGVNFTQLFVYSTTTEFSISAGAVGLYATNGCDADDGLSTNACLAKFGEYEMRPITVD